MNETTTSPLRTGNIAVGDSVKPMEIALTPTMVVAGAIASRDFMPVHHDKDYAQTQGALDIFMNILSTNAYMSRFVTDWAGPETMVRKINIRLGVPAIPNKTLRFTGEVLGVKTVGDENVIEVSVKATNELGDHATGTVELSLPAASARFLNHAI